MAIDPIAAGASPRAVVPPVTAVPSSAGPRRPDAGPGPLLIHQVEPVAPLPQPRTIEISVHHDLKVLMTKVMDAVSRDVVAQFPAAEVLDAVAHLMRVARLREEF